MFQTKLIEDEIVYTGEQLRSLWAYRSFGLLGDSAVAFIGPCDVRPDAMVDIEDHREGAAIRSARMVHFIIEHFRPDLALGVARQRILMMIIGDLVNARIGRPQIRRRGDDLYDGGRKLSVSIATVSPVSTLIHAGLNVVTDDVPVSACGLAEYGIDAADLAGAVLDAYARELGEMERARCKVRSVP